MLFVVLSAAKDLHLRTVERLYYVYILASRSRNLYIGVTRDIERRVLQHRSASGGFTTKYRITRLVHVEQYQEIGDAITREKQLKGWVRRRKLALINEHNPGWVDFLSEK